MRFNLHPIIHGLIGLFLLGCSGDTPTPQPTARPVTYLVLQTSNPASKTRLTGSVDSWKREMLSFRVEGRVNQVVEPGVEISGRIIGADGELISEGTLLATLESDTYTLQRDEAAAALESAAAQVQLAETELEESIPQRINFATAEFDQKRSEYERLKTLITQRAVSQSEFDEAESEFKQAEAALADANAARATKIAEVAALKASRAEAEQRRRQAELNLNDCQVYSPFTGQVSKVHAIAGSYLKEGMPVVTMQMMDPVKVEIAVSQQTDRELRYNDQVSVFVEGMEQPLAGLVYLKDTVADTATRTFNVTILVRNRLLETAPPPDSAGDVAARTTDIYALESELADGEPPFFADEKSLHRDDEGNTFVWKVENLTADDLSSSFDPVFTVSKVMVKTGEKSLPILQVYQGRELSDLGELDPTSDLITGALPPNVKDGDSVFLSRPRWMLRPGQLVHIELQNSGIRPGFYVPSTAIQQVEGKDYAYILQESDSGSETARRIEVTASEALGEFRRIESSAEGELEEGDRLILEGVHYLSDGDVVNGFEKVEVGP